MTTFAAQINAWTAKTRARKTAVVQKSAQDVIAVAQTPVAKGGRMPVDTGFLRNSLQSSLNGSTPLSGAESYAMVVAQMEAGDVAEFGWTAEYARHVEYGARGRPGRFFVGGAAQKWPQIVAANIAKAKAAVNG